MSQILIQESKYEKYARALENTKYEQCTGSVRKGESRCAIGVILSEIYGWDGSDDSAEHMKGRFFRDIGYYMYDGIWRRNDGCYDMSIRRHSFKEIAQWLREQKE